MAQYVQLNPNYRKFGKIPLDVCFFFFFILKDILSRLTDRMDPMTWKKEVCA